MNAFNPERPAVLDFIRSYYFDVLPRDPNRNPDFPGVWMATDRDDLDDDEPSGFCIVGDDPEALLAEVANNIIIMAPDDLDLSSLTQDDLNFIEVRCSGPETVGTHRPVL